MVKCPSYFKIVAVLIAFIGYGDGRWRKKDREVFEHDIETFKKMAEKIEHEIKIFYEEESEVEFWNDNVDEIQRKNSENILNNNINSPLNGQYGTANNFYNDTGINKSYERTNAIKDTKQFVSEDSGNVSKIYLSSGNKEEGIKKELNPTASTWPRFEDLLRAMGKRYDWKNDRWIKVKRNFKNYTPGKVSLENSVDLHTKHNFRYRFVKLNRSKGKRNVMIAVTAVR